MTDAEILQKAKIKAQNNGWWPKVDTTAWCAMEVIFSHDFAKAFWGKEVEAQTIKYQQDMETISENGEVRNTLGEVRFSTISVKGWQYHLQQMVLEENPVKYLEKFL